MGGDRRRARLGPGLNFGYPLLEGTHPLLAAEAPGTVAPVYELRHGSGNCAVSSFGQDPAGEVYVVSQAKGVLRVDPR